MTTDISLHELLNLSIGTPDAGSVNFGALHTLLQAILGHLKIERVTIAWKEMDQDHSSPSQLKVCKSSPYNVMEEKLRRIEEQISALEALPSASELMSSDTAVTEMWTLMQLRRKVQGNEDGVSKCMTLIQDLLKEIQVLRVSRDDLKKEVKDLYNQLSQLNMSELTDRIIAMEQYCHQVGELDNTTKELKEKISQYPLPGELTQCVTWEVMQAALISERQKLQQGLKDTITIPAAKDTLDQGTKVLKNDPVGPAAVDLSPGVQCPQQSLSDGALFTVMGRRLSRVSIGAEQYPETVEALMEVGRLRERHEILEARIEQLEANKADQSQLQHLSDLLTAMGEREIPDHVPEQLNYLKTLVDTLITEKEKVSVMESVKAPESGEKTTGSVKHQDRDSSQTKQFSQHISNRSAVQKLDGKVQMLMREKIYRAEEKSSKDRHMQEQNSELMSDVQGAILQLQAECEKLHSSTNHLMEEHSKKETQINHLYKRIEELNENKADKELVEMEIEIKADKQALESKVSRMQFDSMTEQLNGMFQELLSKISGQEQDWHKVIEKISTEMECKLNRIELDPLKKQLEDRWRSISKQLQTPPVPEQDDAAGFRKQLVTRFHCISCDRPVDMITPGQHLVSLPSAPALPSRKSNRPYTVYELEQVRQHYRSERIPEMADYSYLARNCGGSHTLSHPNRRYTRLQHITQLIQTEEGCSQAEEVDIIGLDGHVYKGRVNSRMARTTESRLPTISPREGNYKSKDKVSRSQSQRSSGVEAGHASPTRPQSAKTQRTHSASSSSVRERPMSSMDCLPQGIQLQSSFHDTTTEPKQGLELHKNLSQSEDEPVTSL